MTVRGDFTGSASAWLLLDWHACPGCGHPCRIIHRALGTCMTCALPVMRAGKAMATNGGAR